MIQQMIAELKLIYTEHRLYPPAVLELSKDLHDRLVTEIQTLTGLPTSTSLSVDKGRVTLQRYDDMEVRVTLTKAFTTGIKVYG